MSAASDFERELEIFRTEADGAAQYLYAYLSIHETAGHRRSVHALLNTAPLFWNTTLSALQASVFIVLGRIFDQESAHNIDRLLGTAQRNPGIFSKTALGTRKQGPSSGAPPWLADYLATSYVPDARDFRNLRALVKKNRAIYEARYRDIRRKWFAHKELSDPEEIGNLFAKTNIDELQKVVTFTGSLYDALWELYINGRQPIVRQRRYSIKAMHQRPTPPRRSSKVQERISLEAAMFLRNAAKQIPIKKKRYSRP
jgi:HEPN superfamily AbiU2-like protein